MSPTRRLLPILALLPITATDRMPAQSRLGEPRAIAEGVDLHEVELHRGDRTMTVWIYVPQGTGKVPVVLIAPAGSPMVHGMDLVDADRPEHVPYARAGHVVVSYTIDGPVAGDVNDEEFVNAMREFRAASAGVDNARAALDFALEAVDRADPERVFAAGHSSAATLALQVAVSDERIRGVMAYAPVADLEANFGDDGMATVEGVLPGMGDFIRSVSPVRNLERLQVPVLLVHALDDQNVSIDESRRFAGMLGEHGVEVTLVEAPSGGHYDSMIQRGIPEGLAWLRARTGHGGTQADLLLADAVDFDDRSARGRVGPQQELVVAYRADTDSAGLVQVETGGALDTLVAVVDEEGRTVLGQNDDIDEDNLLSRVRFHAEPGRTYFLRVRVYGTGSGEISVDRRVLSPGSLAERSADRPADVVTVGPAEDRVYRLSTTTGGTLSVRARGRDELFDTVLRIFDAEGRMVAENDDLDETTLDAGASIEVGEDETYYVQIMGFDGASAEFRLEVVEPGR